MRKTKLLVLSILIIGMVLLSFTGCNKEGDLTKITVSEVTHSIFYSPQYAAISLGFFEEEGLKIELINGGGADKVMTAVLSGQVDIGFSGSESVYVYNEGRMTMPCLAYQLTQKDVVPS